ncbi:MAG: histidine kinase dimerization/phospho-acceptor domain-containing protein [Chlorobiales bacterium]
MKFEVERIEREKKIFQLRNVELKKANEALSHALKEGERLRKLADEQREQALRQQQLAEQANAIKTEFLGVAAHDLRNPLSVIAGFAGVIEKKSRQSQRKTKCPFTTRGIERNGFCHQAKLAAHVKIDFRPTRYHGDGARQN